LILIEISFGEAKRIGIGFGTLIDKRAIGAGDHRSHDYGFV
jgi:hypothetical protein